MIILSI